MFYKLSNIAERKEMETLFGVPFEYPALHCSRPIINGLNEENINVILQDKPQTISIAIWGILPEHFVDEWQVFQNVSNTLNIGAETLKYNSWYHNSLYDRRCLILVSGYFATLLKDGKLYPYYVYLKSKKPFCIAGIYNRLDDGFVTASIIISKNFGLKRKVEDIYSEGPIVLDEEDAKRWISYDLAMEEIEEIIENPFLADLKAHPVAKEFYKNDIIFNGILDPVNYKDIPTQI